MTCLRPMEKSPCVGGPLKRKARIDDERMLLQKLCGILTPKLVPH